MRKQEIHLEVQVEQNMKEHTMHIGQKMDKKEVPQEQYMEYTTWQEEHMNIKQVI